MNSNCTMGLTSLLQIFTCCSPEYTSSCSRDCRYMLLRDLLNRENEVLKSKYCNTYVCTLPLKTLHISYIKDISSHKETQDFFSPSDSSLGLNPGYTIPSARTTDQVIKDNSSCRTKSRMSKSTTHPKPVLNH